MITLLWHFQGKYEELRKADKKDKTTQQGLKVSGTFCALIVKGLTHCGLVDFNEILDEYYSSQLQWLMAEIPAVKLSSGECH